MKKLGILGGMGPGATVYFYGLITERTAASSDQEHIPMAILSSCGIPDRTEAILSCDREKQNAVYSMLLSGMKSLKDLGCDYAAIPCNTSHFFADRLEEESGLKIINMIRETAAAVREEEVVILATDGTARTGLYQKALAEFGKKAILPDRGTQAQVMHIIYDVIKAGKTCTKEDWSGIERFAAGRRSVLGCTELSVAAAQLSLDGACYTDALKVLCDRCITSCGASLR